MFNIVSRYDLVNVYFALDNKPYGIALTLDLAERGQFPVSLVHELGYSTSLFILYLVNLIVFGFRRERLVKLDTDIAICIVQQTWTRDF